MILVLPLVLGCTTIPATGDPEAGLIEALSEMMLGDFATSPDNLEATIIDRRVAIAIDGETGFWFYSQLNTGDDQKLYRQRFHHVSASEDGQSLVQRSYVPVNAERLVDAWMKKGALTQITAADMKPALGEGCEQVWKVDTTGVWRGTVDPKTCTIFSQRRQQKIGIGADGYYDGNSYGTSERGFDENMNKIWGSEPGQYITLRRCSSTKCEQEAQVLAERGR